MSKVVVTSSKCRSAGRGTEATGRLSSRVSAEVAPNARTPRAAPKELAEVKETCAPGAMPRAEAFTGVGAGGALVRRVRGVCAVWGRARLRPSRHRHCRIPTSSTRSPSRVTLTGRPGRLVRTFQLCRKFLRAEVLAAECRPGPGARFPKKFAAPPVEVFGPGKTNAHV